MSLRCGPEHEQPGIPLAHDLEQRIDRVARGHAQQLRLYAELGRARRRGPHRVEVLLVREVEALGADQRERRRVRRAAGGCSRSRAARRPRSRCRSPSARRSGRPGRTACRARPAALRVPSARPARCGLGVGRRRCAIVDVRPETHGRRALYQLVRAAGRCYRGREEGSMAHAEVEERQLLKAMTWWDGFVVALANPGFLIAALGASIGVLGTTGRVRPVDDLRAASERSRTTSMPRWRRCSRRRPAASRCTRTRRGASTSRSSARSRPSATGSRGRACWPSTDT